MMGLVFFASAQNKSYIFNHKVIAEILATQYGIPAPGDTGSSCGRVFSGGKGPAAKVLNNHFGIEGKNHYVNHRGHKSRYKEYANEIASYIDFCKLISHKRFYNKLRGNDKLHRLGKGYQ